MKKEMGFGVAGILVAVVAVGVIGLLGWRIYEAAQIKNDVPAATNTSTSTSSTESSQTEQQQVTPAAPTHLVVSEFGVKIPLNDALKGATYTLYEGEANRQWARLTTPRLTEIAKQYSECKDADKTTVLARSQPGDDHLGTPWTESGLASIGKKIGSYYYYPASWQACFTDNTDAAYVKEVSSIRENLGNAIRAVEPN